MGKDPWGHWRDTSRRLADGIRIETRECGVDGWILFILSSVNGMQLFCGVMMVEEAFTEIPHQLDKARRFEELLAEQAKVEY